MNQARGPEVPEQVMTRRECEQKMNDAKDDFVRIQNKIEGPPHPGMEEKLNTLLVELRTAREIQGKEHKSNTARLNIVIAILLCIAAYVAIVISVTHPVKSELDPAKIFHTQAEDPVISYSQPQESSIPPL